MTNEPLRDFMAVSKALSDESRVRIVALLHDRSLCVCQITAVLNLAPSTVSKHLSLLRQAGLLEVEKRGRWIHCRLAEREAPTAAKQALSWLRSSLKRTARLDEDRRLLARVMKISPERLCKRILGC